MFKKIIKDIEWEIKGRRPSKVQPFIVHLKCFLTERPALAEFKPKIKYLEIEEERNGGLVVTHARCSKFGPEYLLAGYENLGYIPSLFFCDHPVLF